MNAPQGMDPATRLLEMINANFMTQAIGVAAQLDLADHLAAGPLGIAALAGRTGCHADSLERLLRALEGLGVVAREGDAWSLTALGAVLRADGEPSLRSWAIYSATHAWKLWGHLVDCVRTGDSARKLLTGREGYAHLQADPQAAAVFNRAMEEVTQLIASAVARAGGFGSMAEVVDVGGGHGELLVAILAAHPRLRGIVFDLEHAGAGAARALGEAGLEARARFQAGSFFERLPAGADAYLLKSIVHNWDDARAVEILKAVRAAAAPGARVMLVERVLPEGRADTVFDRLTLRSDLNMLVGLGGRERTAAHMGELLAQAGFTLTRCESVGYGFSLLEAS